MENGTYFLGAGSGLGFKGGFSRSKGFRLGTYSMLLKPFGRRWMRLEVEKNGKSYINGIEPFDRTFWTVNRIVLRNKALETAESMVFVLLI